MNDQLTMEFKGTHGTFRDYYVSIQRTGIKCDSKGRIGWGFYIWNESPHFLHTIRYGLFIRRDHSIHCCAVSDSLLF